MEKVTLKAPLTKTPFMSANLRFAGIVGMKQVQECSITL